jgi:hypothetical protein
MLPSTSEPPRKSPKPLSVLESVLDHVLGFALCIFCSLWVLETARVRHVFRSYIECVFE